MSHPEANIEVAGRIVVIGVGNPYRQDDGAGIHVVRALAGRVPPGVDLVESDGEATRLLDAWAGADLAVVVDAVHTHEAPTGTLHRLEVDEHGRLPTLTRPRGAGSSHVLGPGEAIALGATLDRLPSRLVIVGIEGEAFDFGPACSPCVAAACDEAAALVLAEVRHAPRRGRGQGRKGDE